MQKPGSDVCYFRSNRRPYKWSYIITIIIISFCRPYVLVTLSVSFLPGKYQSVTLKRSNESTGVFGRHCYICSWSADNGCSGAETNMSGMEGEVFLTAAAATTTTTMSGQHQLFVE